MLVGQFPVLEPRKAAAFRFMLMTHLSTHSGKWTNSLSKSLQHDFNSRQRWLLDNKWVLSPKETQAVSYRTDGKLKRMEAHDSP